MKDVIILSIGYNYYAIQGKPAVAGKLLELLVEALPVEKLYDHEKPAERYRIEPKSLEIRVEMIERRNLLPPKPEDLAKDGAIEIRALPGFVKLLGRGRA